jgi:uncharacterized protein YjbI with pentapeptide repeats
MTGSPRSRRIRFSVGLLVGLLLGGLLLVSAVVVARAEPTTLVVGGVFLVLVVLLVASVWKLPALVAQLDQTGWPPDKDMPNTRNAVRVALLQGFTSMLLIIGAFSAYQQLRTGQRTLAVSTEAQQTERFSRAVGQLGDPNSVDVRLGGIFTLAALADQVPAQRPVVARILASYVQRHATPPAGQPASNDQPLPLELTMPDVQAALDYLATRSAGGPDLATLALDRVSLRGAQIGGASGAQLGHARLPRADLTGARLVNAHLAGAVLTEAALDQATLRGAVMPGALLVRATVRDADLSQVDLSQVEASGANLHGVDLAGATLRRAVLLRADLSSARHLDGDVAGADLRGADLGGADLRQTKGLTDANLTDARCDDRTLLPARGTVRCDRGVFVVQ